MPDNVFQKLNDKYLDQHPLNEKGLESKILQQANTFSTFGRVFELYGLNALQAALEMVSGGGSQKEPSRTSPNRPAQERGWNSGREELPQAPKEGILGRFRPSEGGRGLD